MNPITDFEIDIFKEKTIEAREDKTNPNEVKVRIKQKILTMKTMNITKKQQDK